MKGKWMLTIVLIMIFSGGRMALADSGHKTTNQNGQSEQNMEEMDMSKDGKSDSHNQKTTKSEHVSGDDHDTKGADMEEMNMEGSDDHGHEPVKEKPANVKVLGTYGAVNLSFILIGVWNKWFRREDGFDGNSK